MSEFFKCVKRNLKTGLLSMMGVLVSISVYAQQITVTGTVVDAQGQALIGVTVTTPGDNTRGTVTDIDGKYAISVPGESTVLEFSFVGFTSQEFTVGARRVIDVTLTESANEMDEIVVIAPGFSQVRANLTGSVSSVSGAALERIPTASVAEALAGKVAGVVVTTVDGEPGAEVNFRIRGGTSITQENKPLFIVDGFPTDNINNIPTTDILSIDILKDASLTAIYGARGGNGVVIVTTKSARAGKISVSFNHSTQVRSLSRSLDVLDPYEWVLLQFEANVNKNFHWRNSGAFRKLVGSDHDMVLYKGVDGIDWQDEIMGSNPMSYMYNFTVTGGTETLNFSSSITHNDEKGLLANSGVMRTNVNTKINIQIAKNLRLLLNPQLNFRRNNGAGSGSLGSGGIVEVLRFRPTNGIRDFANYQPSVLDPLEEERFWADNPRDRINQDYKQENINSYDNLAAIEWSPIKGLMLRSDGKLGWQMTDDNRFHGAISSDGLKNNNLPLAEITTKKRNQYTWQNTASYGFSLQEIHNFSFLAGQELTHSQTRQWVQKARYFPKDITAERALANMHLGEANGRPTSSETTPDRSVSFFGQASYNYMSKYLFQATFRADASTKFAPEHRWGYFPAVSAGWVISEEDFMQDQNIISFLKLRGGIGLTGNNRIDDDLWRYQYQLATGTGPGFGETKDNGYEYYENVGDKGSFPNFNIKWEKALNRSVALDIQLFDGRLSITPEVYYNTITDLLYKSNINTTTGYPSQMQNIAKVTSQGWDLNIEGQILEGPDYYLNANFNIGYNKRTIDKLNGDERYFAVGHGNWKSKDWGDQDYRLEEGKDIGLIYGLQFDGLYTYDDFETTGSYNWDAWEQRKDLDLVDGRGVFGVGPGIPKFKNITNFNNGDASDYNVINQFDRVVIGNTTPKAAGGFGFSGGWKAFDFSANFTYMLDFDVYNANRYELSMLEGNDNRFFNVLTDFNKDKRWRYLDDNGVRLTNEQLIEQNAGKTVWHPIAINKRVAFDSFVEDGTFLRVQDVTIGYTLPKRITEKFAVERLRVYAQAYNLFLFTNYSGYDPEVDVMSGLTPSMDYNKYPRSRNFVFGINLTF